MLLPRRLSLVTIPALILALAAGSARAASPAPPPTARIAQTSSTPEQLCAAATETLVEPETREFAQAEETLQDGVDYWAVICTQAGPIYLDLFEDKAPITVNNFVFLAQQGYYNNTTFHRVLPGFMAQGGDPTATGTGGPGYQFEDETDNGLAFDQVGLLAMANAGPDTNGSQFFITYGLPAYLNGLHTIFGQVYQGIDVAELLAPRDPENSPSYEGATLRTIVIVEDSSRVSATPDTPPSLDHIQAVLVNIVTIVINTRFALDETVSHVYDLDAETDAWRSRGGADLADFMRAYLSDKGFAGTAEVFLKLAECPASPTDLPIWAIGLAAQDFSAADNAQAVVFDDARADKLVETGAFSGYTDPADLTGRVFTIAVAGDDWCGANGVLYHFEFPYGRYVLSTDLVLDGDLITYETQPSVPQYLAAVAQGVLFDNAGGVLDRGNAAAE